VGALLSAGVLIAALEALLVGLLFVPVHFTVSARTGTGVRFRVRWLFGLVRMTGAAPRREPGRRRPRTTAREHLGRGRSIRDVMAIEGLLSRIGSLVRELIQSIGFRRGRVAVRAGVGDPAGTGELCGLVGPLLAWRPWSPALQVTFEPDFADAVFLAEAEGSGRVVPIRLVRAIGRFALSRPGMQLTKVLVWNANR